MKKNPSECNGHLSKQLNSWPFFAVQRFITKRNGTLFKRFWENTDIFRKSRPHRIKKSYHRNVGWRLFYMSDICLLVCCLHAFRDLCEITRAQVRGCFVHKKNGLFTEILKMTNTISESEVMTFITSHIIKMNSHHNLTHYLIISNLILSYNLYSSWIICSLVGLQPIFKNAFLA
jgi:hypothetical protein